MSCLVAKSKGVKKTIALVENIDYMNFSQAVGVDTMLNKKLIAANSIFRFVRKGSVVSVASIRESMPRSLSLRSMRNQK